MLLGAGQTGLSIAKQYHMRIADVFTAEKTQTSSRSQETRPLAAADRAKDANCSTATVNAAKPSLQRYQATVTTAPSPVHFDTPPPATPQRALLEPPPELPPNPPLRKAQNSAAASEIEPHHGWEATARLCACFVSHLFASSDVPLLHHDTLPPGNAPAAAPRTAA
jgi:hypothetical protein